jgi:hypothetical protein
MTAREGPRLRRRDAFRAAGAAALGLAVGAPAGARAATGEAGVVKDLILREQAADLAYGLAIKSLGSGAPELLHTLRGNTAAHWRALSTELAAIGLGQPWRAWRLDQIPGTPTTLATATGLAAVRTAATALEDELVAAYRQAIPQLPDAKIAMTAATILGSHAQQRLILQRNA